ncbi:MAG: RluA family pseudouridine synthase [Myxococcaceae bacterium]|nr:RluA family pseudouridine synthase [Myxococcaceae bacterium]
MASRRVQVPKGEKIALEKFLVRAVPNADAARVKQWLEQGRVRVNGKLAKPGRKTWGGETVEVELPAPPPAPHVEGPPVPVLAETADLLIVDKPSGLTVEPEPGQVSLVELIATQRGPFDVGGSALPGVVHRLDKETSGCLALARTDDGVALLERGFQDKRIDKRYLAFVAGTPPETGSLDTPYTKGPDGKYTTKLESPRRARLSWIVKERFGDSTLLEIDLDTGRTHQIRVQLGEAGFPVLGDRLHGRPFDRVRLDRLALHAARLELDLPALALTAEAPLPPELISLQRALRST